jgi:hypothetical protein
VCRETCGVHETRENTKLFVAALLCLTMKIIPHFSSIRIATGHHDVASVFVSRSREALRIAWLGIVSLAPSRGRTWLGAKC